MTTKAARTRIAINGALLPYKMSTAVKAILKQTPEYEQARAEGRSRAWLEAESMSLGYALAEVIMLRLADLDAGAGS